MKHISRKKIIIAIILLTLLIIEVIAVGLSRANKTIDIVITAHDSSNVLADKKITIEATKNDDKTYSLTLPEEIEGYYFDTITWDRKTRTDDTDYDAVDNEIRERNLVSYQDEDGHLRLAENNSDENSTSADENTISETQKTYDEIVAKHTKSTYTSELETNYPGKTITLTNVEVDSKEISAKAVFTTKKVGDNTYYKKSLSTKTDYNGNSTEVTVSGYMPLNSKLILNGLSKDEKNNISNVSLNNYENQDSIEFYDAYEPKIMYNDDSKELDVSQVSDNNFKKFDNLTINENIKVTFSSLPSSYYKLLSVNDTTDDYTVAEIANVESNSSISYDSSKLGKYAILRDTKYDVAKANAMMMTSMSLMSTASTTSTKTLSTWDGTVATSFALGSGTFADPYLITSGSELAYLAQQVNAGTTYEGQYFKLVVDIDLNKDNNTWTPIGLQGIPFAGYFDGQGHTIRNARIEETRIPKDSKEYYADGLFGAVGGGTSRGWIRNIQLSDFDLEFNSSGTMGSKNNYNAHGYYIGTLVGILYNNFEIDNCIAKESQIVKSNSLNMDGNAGGNRAYVGGLVGAIKNADDNYTDGGSSRSTIQYCYSNVDINMKNIICHNNYNYYYYHYLDSCLGIGGIVGAVIGNYSKPSMCVYNGSIQSDFGLVGPITGIAIGTGNPQIADENSTDHVWSLVELKNGDDGKNFNNYYYQYSVNGTTYKSSRNNISNNVDNNTTYRNSTEYNKTSYDTYNYHYMGVNGGTYISSFDSTITKDNTTSKFIDIVNARNNSSDTYVTWSVKNNNYSLDVPLDVTIQESSTKNTYQAVLNYENTSAYTYNYTWYVDSVNKNNNTNTITQPRNWTNDYNLLVVVNNGHYIAADSYKIAKYELHFTFTLDESNKKLTATLAGTGLDSDDYKNNSNYSYQWGKLNTIETKSTDIDGATSNILTNIEKGNTYSLTAQNGIEYMKVMGSYRYGEKNVIYVSHSTGSDTKNDGKTPQTPFRTMKFAYASNGKTVTTNSDNNSSTNTHTKDGSWQATLSDSGTMNQNVIVVMDYNDSTGEDYQDSFLKDNPYFKTVKPYRSANSNGIYNKKATITGEFGLDSNGNPIDYRSNNPTRGGTLNFVAHDYFNVLEADTTFTELNFYGSRDQTYFVLQGHSLIMDEGLKMISYSYSDTNQGLLLTNKEKAPAFHIFAGWLQYGGGNSADIPTENNVRLDKPTITIKSGTYGRILGGGTNGHKYQETLDNTYICGSSSIPFCPTINVEISDDNDKNGFTYDINLLCGGGASGSTYSNPTINVKSGSVARLLGASIGDSSNQRTTNTDIPSNTFIGKPTITLTGGSVGELYGGCLGRNMDQYGSIDYYVNTKPLDVFFYGQITINIADGASIQKADGSTGTVYGAGAGGISGYYKDNDGNTNGDTHVISGTEKIVTSSTINISGGMINADVYGGGYGYTEYLNYISSADNSGALYGDSYINISGKPTVKGNIYASGRGARLTNRTKVAEQIGTTNIVIEGTPTISGSVYGAGEGFSDLDDVAKLTGTAKIENKTDTNFDIYGGGKNAAVEGKTSIRLTSGSNSKTIYGGGEAADVTKSTNISVRKGDYNIIYGGSNTDGTVKQSKIIVYDGTIKTIFGGNNLGGTTTKTNIEVQKGDIGDFSNDDDTDNGIYGGGNQATTTETNIVIAGTNDNGITNIYAGGKSADVTSYTYVNVLGGKVKNTFGGSNQSGTCDWTDVIIGKGEGSRTSSLESQDFKVSFKINQANYGDKGQTWWQYNDTLKQYKNMYQLSFSVTNNTDTDTNKWTAIMHFANYEKLHFMTKEDNSSEWLGCASEFNDDGDLVCDSRYLAWVNAKEDPNWGEDAKYIKIKAGETVGIGTLWVASNEEPDAALSEMEAFNYNELHTDDLNITNIFGGNNQGGQTNTAHVFVYNGNVTTVCGGGNLAPTTTTNVIALNTHINNLYGAGLGDSTHTANVETTNVTLAKKSLIYGKAFGGGNYGTVSGNTNVNIQDDATIQGSIFAGGNGQSATVSGDTNLTIGGVAEKYNKKETADTIAAYVPTMGSAKDSTSGYVYGGGNEAEVSGSTNLKFYNGHAYASVFGGGKKAKVNATNVTICGKAQTDSDIYGGGDEGEVTTNTNVVIEDQINLNGNVFAGGNGSTAIVNGNTNLSIGGLSGETTDTTSTPSPIIGAKVDTTLKKGCVYGGGNAAEVKGNTKISITRGTFNNIFGGGNEGIVDGNTEVTTGPETDSDGNSTNYPITVRQSIFGGGNIAEVDGNTLVNIYGDVVVGDETLMETLTSKDEINKVGSIFGGGNLAVTGLESNKGTTNASINIVNIASGTINKNVYGSGNRSEIYGDTLTNIGLQAIKDNQKSSSSTNRYEIPDTASEGNIKIAGTVFGGGQSSLNGDPNLYEYNKPSVEGDVNVNIDGTNYDNLTFEIDGSIFGSGYASVVTGSSKINISNFGTVNNPKNLISIQRTNELTIDKSALTLIGITDSTNKYNDTLYTLNRIKKLYIVNGSTIYLNHNANLLQEWDSGIIDDSGNFTKASITIDENGNGDPNVRNNVFLFEGMQLQILKTDSDAAGVYGDVNGMTYLGLFQDRNNPYGSTDMFGINLKNGDPIEKLKDGSTKEFGFTSVMGRHKENHNTHVDGFYTNTKVASGEGDNVTYSIKRDYVGVTPEKATYYMWTIGDIDVITYETTLTASKFSTLGTTPLSFKDFSVPNTLFELSDVTYNLNDGIQLIHQEDIPTIAASEDDANSKFGLAIKTGDYGWKNKARTDFYNNDTEHGVSSGDITYQSESSSGNIAPVMECYLYSSQNISTDGDLGTVSVSFNVFEHDDTSHTMKRRKLIIIFTLKRKLLQEEAIEQTIHPGKLYEILTKSALTQINSKGSFTTFDSLHMENIKEKEKANQYMNSKRALVSRKGSDVNATDFPLKAGTRISMIDLIQNKQFYYVVTDDDEKNNVNVYYFSKFKEMGSTDKYYNESLYFNSSDTSVPQYYNSKDDSITERYLFQYDFNKANITDDLIDLTSFMEYRYYDDSKNKEEVVLSVLNEQRDSNKYSIYTNSDGKISIDATPSRESIILGDNDEIFDVNASLDLTSKNSSPVYDTNFFDEQLGVQISVYNNNNDKLSGSSLLGIYYTVDGNTDSNGELTKYYPRYDGSVRIPLANKVSNVESNVTLHTSDNKTLPTGTYTFRFESYSSPDGYYYGENTSEMYDATITINNEKYGLKATTPDEEKIFKSDTGFNSNGNSNLDVTINYENVKLTKPLITVDLERNTGNLNTAYESVDLNKFFTGGPTEKFNEQTFESDHKYILSKDPKETITTTYNLNAGVETGTYKLVYSLYSLDETTNKYIFIGETYEYFIVN